MRLIKKMPFDISIDDAQKKYPEYNFLSRLTLSSYKAAFKVQDEAGDTYCLKILSPENNQSRVLREVQSHTSFHHPNISTLYKHIYMDEGGLIKHYLLEEFIDGVDLSDKIDSGYVFEEKEAILFFTQLASALAELSRHNIVHRDIKPSNIRVRNCGSPVLIDFGTVRCLDQSSLTATFQGAQ
jgi:serine/threonine protein kinase